MKKYRLDKEEREILGAVESGQWESVKPKKSTLSHYSQIAKNTRKKSKCMSSSISNNRKP